MRAAAALWVPVGLLSACRSGADVPPPAEAAASRIAERAAAWFERQRTPGLAATLVPVQDLYFEDEPADVELRVAWSGQGPCRVPANVLLGGGVEVSRALGDGRFEVWGRALPDLDDLTLLPGSSFTVRLDLAATFPAAFAEPGTRTVVHDELPTAPLELDVWRDCTGLRARVETDFGALTVELLPDAAPRTVHNFVGLVESGFYDNLTFHRVVEGFMIQGGCPVGDGTGNAGWTVPFEPNGLVHDRGTVAMARQADLDSASCQFFVCQQRTPFLDGNYTIFGRVVDGLDTLDRIAAVPCEWAVGGVDGVPSRPKDKVFIRRITLEPAAAAAAPPR